MSSGQRDLTATMDSREIWIRIAEKLILIVLTINSFNKAF